MISRTTIGRSFAGIVHYQFEGRKQQPSEKEAEVLAAVGVRARSAAQMTADFNRGRQLNPNLVQAVWHTSLSFNPDDAARLDSELMGRIAEDYVRKMGLDQTQYVIIRHHDQPENQHLHIIANRVGNDGKTIKDGRNFYRSKKVLQELIQAYGLTPPQGLRPEKHHPTQLQGAELTKEEVRQALQQALRTAINRPTLLAALQAQQITAREFVNKAGEVTGISFEKEGTVFKGSQLGRGYSWAGIARQLTANQAAHQVKQQQAAHQAAERQASQLPSATVPRPLAAVAGLPELPAIERKWQADYQTYTAKLAQQNAAIQTFNKTIDRYNHHLQVHPTEEGVAAVLQDIDQKADPRLATLQVELTNQVRARTRHAQQWDASYGQEAALRKQLEWSFFKREVDVDLARKKLALLAEPSLPLPSLLEPDLLTFAQAVKAATQPVPPIGFAASSHYQPEQVRLSLSEYAAQREAERQAVVEIRQPVDQVQIKGYAESLQRLLMQEGAHTQLAHRLNTQGDRVSELVVRYSVHSPQLVAISKLLDWTVTAPGYRLQERPEDRVQRQAPGQRLAQEKQARTQQEGKSKPLGGPKKS